MAIAVFHILFSFSDVGGRLEPGLMDYWFLLRGSRPVPQQIAIVAIDERSHQALGVSTLQAVPRAVQARLLNKLADYGAQKVMIDLIFRSPGDDLAGDQNFAEAMKRLPVYLGKYIKFERRRGLNGGEEQREDVALPLPEFSQAARGTVFLNLPLDDRVVRRFMTGLEATDDFTPMSAVVFANGEGHRFPGTQDFLDYYGPMGSVPTVSLSDLVNDDAGALAPFIKGRVIFVGTQMLTQTGLIEKDTFLTPYSGAPFFGVEIHATAAGNLLEQHWIRRLSPLVELTAINVTALLISVALCWLRPTRGVFVLLGSALGWWALSYALFLNGVFLPGFVLTLITLPLGFIVSTFYYYLVLQRSYRDIESALGVELKVRE